MTAECSGMDVICYKGKTEIDAILAWSIDHAAVINQLRCISASAPHKPDGNYQSTFMQELASISIGLEVPSLANGLRPEESWKDAKNYMAQLVCYVGNNHGIYNSSTKALDYVFRIARDGSRLYADCKYARTLIAKYGKQKSTIQKEAKILHKNETHFRKRKWTGMEKPPTMTQLAQESEIEELQQIRRDKANARR